MLPITTLFASFLTLYFVHLAVTVIRLRRSHRVALGAGGHKELEGAIRAHGNFAEYVPLGLILLGLLELHKPSVTLVVVLGGLLAAGRVIHARALRQGDLKLRVHGMMLTFGALIALALADMFWALKAWHWLGLSPN